MPQPGASGSHAKLIEKGCKCHDHGLRGRPAVAMLQHYKCHDHDPWSVCPALSVGGLPSECQEDGGDTEETDPETIRQTRRPG